MQVSPIYFLTVIMKRVLSVSALHYRTRMFLKILTSFFLVILINFGSHVISFFKKWGKNRGN